MTADVHARPGQNRLLSALPPAERERLLPHLEPVTATIKQSFYEINEPIGHVYFPCTLVASLVTVMENGAAAEVATVGNEGMVGLPVFLGAERIPSVSFCQVPGSAWRLDAAALREVVQHDGALHSLLHRYTQAMFNQIAQSAACNRLHGVEQRCARWLLQTHDRVGRDQFELTQEFLGQMLGTRRAAVSAAAGALQKAAFIRYSRGRITIVDRAGLEGASCECYRVVRDEFERLIR
jgi:CRP-like cAMP-binding protein